MGGSVGNDRIRARTPSLSAIPPDTLHLLTRGVPPRKKSRDRRPRSREDDIARPSSPLRSEPVISNVEEKSCSLSTQYSSSAHDEYQSFPDHVCTESWRTNCHYCVQTKLLSDLHEEISRVSNKATEAERRHDGESIRRLLARLDELSVRLERVFDRVDFFDYSPMLERPPELPPLNLPPMDEEGFWAI
ncbi:hypothetical protein NEOLEDRAFT_1145551 [Neolentinus lepideus HHB14362 ss-1]|uniref:Uncharacterized protein n=1 Tax=Neolentinus lepideus HHB14362 ss-1 TaxID=1314782 RepID=A0A165UV72_9AGAM|nr:hypothetical protein NEOLEDRAFT_1145551 [Neolentinus lepideus HHB14362 ss-1]